jgi:isopentenyl-diphosphate delta-isomerase
MEDRKKDHIDLAFKSQLVNSSIDNRFYYEPLINPHPMDFPNKFDFLGKKLNAPLWISSMTGGTKLAKKINENLAVIAGEFGLGMGLGSCRILLENNEYLKDFDVRRFISNDYPLYANLGIAQLEEILIEKKIDLVQNLVLKLKADGLIIHVNPMQEWFQPEGNRFKRAPIDTINEFKSLIDFKVIVKEVGQGFGKESLKALLESDVDGIDFASFGGTNFSMLELLRGNDTLKEQLSGLAYIGNTADEMVDIYNRLIVSEEFISLQKKQNKRKDVIISGGIKNFLDGYYLISKINTNAIYGQASKFLQFAKEDIDVLREYVRNQIEGLKLAYAFLRIK